MNALCWGAVCTVYTCEDANFYELTLGNCTETLSLVPCKREAKADGHGAKWSGGSITIACKSVKYLRERQ